jgi:hypothetical protein
MASIKKLERKLEKAVISVRSRPKQAPRRQRVGPRGIRGRGINVHPDIAALKPGSIAYFQALVAPHRSLVPPYVPTAPPRPSQKVTLVATGNVVCSATTGYGMLLVHPCISSTRASITYSNSSTYAGGAALTRSNAAIAGLAGIVMNPVYVDAQLTAEGGLGVGSTSISWRIVSMGIRMRYTGVAQNRAGTVYAISAPDNNDLSGETLQTMYSYPHKVRYNVQEHAVYELVAYGRNTNELSFQNCNQLWNGSNWYPYSSSPGSYWDYGSGSAANSGGAVAAFLLECPTAAPGTFSFDVTMHLEYAGTPIGYLGTPSPADTQGISTVHSVAEQVSLSHSTAPHTERSDHVNKAAQNFASSAGSASLNAISASGPDGEALVGGYRAVTSLVPRQLRSELEREAVDGFTGLFRRKAAKSNRPSIPYSELD